MSDRRARVANTARGFSYEEPLLFERSRSGRVGFSLPQPDVPPVDPASVLPIVSVRLGLTEIVGVVPARLSVPPRIANVPDAAV